jgi:hypothetical protein
MKDRITFTGKSDQEMLLSQAWSSVELHGANIEEAQGISARYRNRCIDAEKRVGELEAALRAVLNLTVSDGAKKIVEVTTAAEKVLTPNAQAQIPPT